MACSRSRLLYIAVAACAFVGTAVSVTYDRVAAAVTAAYRVVRDFVAAAPAAFAQARLPVVDRPVELVQACAYALGIAKRERPHVRSQWRMCPSV